LDVHGSLQYAPGQGKSKGQTRARPAFAGMLNRWIGRYLTETVIFLGLVSSFLGSV